jgi:hypothetical protein
MATSVQVSWGEKLVTPGTDALSKLHGRKLDGKTLLCRMRGGAALTMRGLRFRERAHCEVLRWLWQARWGGFSSNSISRVSTNSH